jgi:hypothetical protein
MTDRLVVKSEKIEGFAYKAGRELYQQTEKIAAQEFGVDSNAYAAIMRGIFPDHPAGSQFFFNTLMGPCLPEGQRIMTFEDLQRIYGADPSFFEGIYSDTSELVLRSAEHHNFSLEMGDLLISKPHKQILENLVGQVKARGLEFSPQNPLVISGVGLTRDDDKDNYNGLLLTLNEDTMFRNDPRFANGTYEIPFGDVSRRLSACKGGLSGLFFNIDGVVDSASGGLSYSEGCGKVVVFDSNPLASKD